MKDQISQTKFEFQQFLKEKGIKSIKHYSSVIEWKMCRGEYKTQNITKYKNLYECTNPQEFDEIMHKLLDNPLFLKDVHDPTKGNFGDHKGAIKKYSEFLHQKNKLSMNTMISPITYEDKEEVMPQISFSKPKSRNTIFYGPPGTGKTYQVRKILEDHFTTKFASVPPEQWEESLVKDFIWREVVAAALKDLGGEATFSRIYKHRLVAAKYRQRGGQQTTNRAWKTLQMHAPEDSFTVKYPSKQLPSIFDRNNDSASSTLASTWKLLPDWEEEAPGTIELLQRFHAGKPAGEEYIRYESVTFHQSYSYEDFVEGIRPILADVDEDASGAVNYEIRPGIFKRICEKATKDPDNDYALFIDEINRGNISKIFAELITLIEENKRLDAEEKMKVTLPYSGKEFGVPRNLYIIGTMNTADRSLALLDRALRRRFDFVPVYPEPSKLPNKQVDGVHLVQLLNTINNRIAVLYDKEHCIGHSYLWDVKNIDQLAHAFAHKILPLLEEYFFEDHNKIRLVLGNAKFYKQIPRDAFLQSQLDDQYPEQCEVDKDALKYSDTYRSVYE
jgi:5-methylcytosine-specific restriction protein B